MNTPDVTTRLNFWGTSVEVMSCAADAQELQFFYGTYIARGDTKTDVSVRLRCLDWPARGFFASSLAGDGLSKSISIVDHHEPERSASSTFTEWSDLVSPFPPFGTATLVTRLATFPGAVVRGRNGTVTALLGGHYVGKTATAISLCREQGAQLISDSLIVLDTNNGVCLTYQTPLGLRRETLQRAASTLDSIEYRLTVSKDTGLVALAQPSDVIGTDNANGGRIDHLVVLSSTDKPGATRLTCRKTGGIGWFTEAAESDVANCLPSEMFHFEAPLDMAPAERARRLSDLLHGVSNG